MGFWTSFHLLYVKTTLNKIWITAEDFIFSWLLSSQENQLMQFYIDIRVVKGKQCYHIVYVLYVVCISSLSSILLFHFPHNFNYICCNWHFQLNSPVEETSLFDMSHPGPLPLPYMYKVYFGEKCFLLSFVSLFLFGSVKPSDNCDVQGSIGRDNTSAF